MKYFLFVVLLCAALSTLQAEPDAGQILAAARMNPLGDQIVLNARLRADAIFATKTPGLKRKKCESGIMRNA